MQFILKKMLQENRLFFGCFVLYLVIGGILLTQIDQGDAVLWANATYEPVKNFIFRYLTHLGDGLFFVGVILIFLGIRYDYALMLAVNFALTGISVVLLKRLFGMPRPLAFFSEIGDLQLIEGVKLYKNHSFPSGHSATAFSLFCGLILISKHKNLGIFYFLCALFATFSRIYLAQHFFIDTYFGAIWGVFLAVCTYLIFENQSEFKKKKWQKNVFKR